MQDKSAELLRRLDARHETISFAESLTGGLIAATLIANSGSSRVLGESYVTYSPEAKQRILGVREETIHKHSVVSSQCAREMAEGVRSISGSTWGAAATGLAGPDGGNAETPVGTVYIAVSNKRITSVRELHLKGDRQAVRTQTVQAVFELLLDEMNY